METVTYLDTHVVAWLYAGLIERFAEPARQRLETRQLRISPMVMLELQYLHEIGRLTVSGSQVVGELGQQLGLSVCDVPFQLVVQHAVQQTWTRDPFDRIVVAHAIATRRELLTKDRVIRDHCSLAVWD